MLIVQQVLFVLLAGVATWIFSKKVKDIRRNILLGRDLEITGTKAERWKKVVLLALGQKKMFKYPLVAIMHFIIYAGFIIINAEVLEIALDGIFGTHRMFAGPLGMLYGWLINSFELLAVLVIVVCVIFLLRRNVLKLKRFLNKELEGWPRSDANYILITEIVLMSLFLTMNAADYQLQLLNDPHYTQTGSFFFSGLISPLFDNMSASTLIAIERTCWWLHITGIFAFLNYLPYSKHLHILMAFPNAYYSSTEPRASLIICRKYRMKYCIRCSLN